MHPPKRTPRCSHGNGRRRRAVGRGVSIVDATVFGDADRERRGGGRCRWNRLIPAPAGAHRAPRGSTRSYGYHPVPSPTAKPATPGTWSSRARRDLRHPGSGLTLHGREHARRVVRDHGPRVILGLERDPAEFVEREHFGQSFRSNRTGSAAAPTPRWTGRRRGCDSAFCLTRTYDVHCGSKAYV